MFTSRFQELVRLQATRVAVHLAKLGITANQVTITGLLIVFLANYLVATSHLFYGAIVLIFGAIFDVLDGAVARSSSKSNLFGAFLDSTLDRFAEAAIYTGLAVYYLFHPNPLFGVLGVMLALIGSFSVSYARARAQSLGFKCESGLFARPERMVSIIIGLFLGGWVLLGIIWALAILTHFTTLQRIREVWLQARIKKSAQG